MAIARRPKKDDTAAKPISDEKKIEALINKGGSSTKAQEPVNEDEDDGIQPIKLNLRKYHHKDIAGILVQLPKRMRLSRHAYVIQALEEKIQRDKKKLK